MSRFDDMVNGLRDEVDIPENVWRGYVQTLAELPEKNAYKVHHGNNQKNKSKNNSKNNSKNSRSGRGAARGISYLKAAAIILISITLLGTSAYAAGKYSGILDFLKGNTNMTPPSAEAEDLIVPVAEQAQEKEEITDEMIADYTVKEAMCDSDSIYVVLEAKAKEAGRYFFVPEDAIAEDPVNDWGIESNISAGEYAESKNLEMVHVNAGIQNTDALGIAVSTIYFQSVSDDVMDIMIECGKTEKEKTLDVICTGIVWDDTIESMDDIMRTEIRFTLTDISNSTSTVYVPSGTPEIPGTGATIEKAEVIQTELGTYLEILYKDESKDRYAVPSIRLTGENAGKDQRIRMGSGTQLLENGEYFWRLSLGKTEFGDNIELETYDVETKEIYGTFELIKQG